MCKVKKPGSPLAMPSKGGNSNLTEANALAVLKLMRDPHA